ncbi:BQ5605_C010g06095 [Microbotryum silenes-dioicae]|uniref:BQ5605_C010g06095 protein n=1 Tax=Microbotryum silenes-dioicae TaxID=796604 RepID=A0A2X0NTE3_9BASI|nr:BQ5605_C010g06095 [Microbotryum silenes-dioicae]
MLTSREGRVSTHSSFSLSSRVQLYRRLAEEAGRVHPKLLRTLQELEADECDPLTRLADSEVRRDGRGFHRGRQVSDEWVFYMGG